MRPTLLFLLAITSLQVMGQAGTAGTRLDLNTATQLAANRPTLHEVIAKLGEPTDELIKFDNAILTYKVNTDVYTFRFDESKRLNNFIFANQNDNLPDHLSYSDVKLARNLKTKAAILHKLGEPTQVIASQEKEVWYYQVGNRTAPQKTLIIHFDPTSPSNVQSYNYYADSGNTPVFSSDVISSFVKGASEDEIESKLGKPSKIILSGEKEDWYYTSKHATLIVYFDKQSRVNDILYHKTSDDSDLGK